MRQLRKTKEKTDKGQWHFPRHLLLILGPGKGAETLTYPGENEDSLKVTKKT